MVIRDGVIITVLKLISASRNVARMKSSDKLDKLLHINRTLAATLDIAEVLRRSLELESAIVDAETGSILLLDPTGEYLEFAVALGGAEHILKSHRIKVGEGISGYVAQTREPLLIADVHADERFNSYFDSKTGFQTHSVLCVPILVEDRLIGVAQAINRVGGGSFTEDDLFLFSAFTGMVGIALENAKLHRTCMDQEKIQQEINAARQVQESYLPRSFPETPGMEFAGQLTPARHVSGDFYDAVPLPGGRIALMVGDVSGKGLAAALYMVRLLTEMRAALRHGENVAAAMGAVNGILCEQSTGGMFVTMVLFLIDPARRKITVANAGHTPYLLKKNGSWQEIQADKNPPIGIIAGRAFTTHDVDILPGTHIVAYTDGLSEGRNSKGEMFGTERLIRLLGTNCLPPQLLLQKILLDLEGFCGDAERADDTTLVSFGAADGGVDCVRSFECLSHPRYLPLGRGMVAQMLGKDVPERTVTETQLAVDEAVSNVIRHTYKNDQTKRVEIAMRRQGTLFETVIRDFGPKIDPAQLVGRALEDVRPGGLGIHFMKTVFDGGVEYDRDVTEGNRLVLRKNLVAGDKK